MKMCESCGEDEVLWLDTTSGDPEPEVEVLCFDCYDKYPWHGRCQLCGVWGWVNSDEKCWGCTCNDEPEEEVERVRCEVCQFWYWEEELIEGLCELCREEDDTEPTNECGLCDLTFDIDALDEDGLCQGCSNTGYCGRCQEYGPRVASWQAGAICVECNKLVEL